MSASRPFGHDAHDWTVSTAPVGVWPERVRKANGVLVVADGILWVVSYDSAQVATKRIGWPLSQVLEVSSS